MLLILFLVHIEYPYVFYKSSSKPKTNNKTKNSTEVHIP